MINLLFCGNEKIFDGLLTATLSIVMRLKRARPLRIWIFTMSLTRVSEGYTPVTTVQAEFIQSALRKYNPDTRVTLVDVTRLYETHLKENANEGCYCTPYTLLRLLADLVELPEKLLYLDADILCNRDISLLYDLDVSGVEYGASRDHYGEFLVQPNYINAGVLLFNMKKCKETGLFERARAILRERKLPFADQSALLRATTKRKMLSGRFNDQKFLYKNTVIRHFSKRLFWFPYPHVENIKPWQVERVREKFAYRSFDDIFEEYLALKRRFST